MIEQQPASVAYSAIGRDNRRVMNELLPLVDAFGRVHTSLRISVTDRCNIRCFYCMPDTALRFLPRSEILTFEEIERLVSIVAPLGITKLRLTGGEPLLRSELPSLVRTLTQIPGIEEVAMTTNGILLGEQAAALKEAGLARLNISLDAMTEEVFRRISRRSGLDRVIAGIEEARRVGFQNIRLNTVAIAGITEPEIVPLVEFARQRQMQLRFIEFMPLDGDEEWTTGQVLTGDEIRRTIADAIGPLVADDRSDPSQPAMDFRFADGSGSVGFINPVSHPFCGDCNRLRVTAEGKLRNCLFSTIEWDARALLRSGASDRDIERLVRECVAAKKPGHALDSPEFLRPVRAMYQIGG